MSRVADQIAALPISRSEDGGLQVLMVTSRRTGRWVVPKGWPMDAQTDWAAAKIEALEEAGAEGLIATDAIGEYHYDKTLDSGGTVRCRVRVFPMLVRKLQPDWKERDLRRRRWYSPKEAATLVIEPGLSRLLLGVAERPRQLPPVAWLLKAS